jgi:hypothetical protein
MCPIKRTHRRASLALLTIFNISYTILSGCYLSSVGRLSSTSGVQATVYIETFSEESHGKEDILRWILH